MTVGSSVGSWRFTLGALRGLMPILATYVAAPTERRCGAKLHWRVIPVGLLEGKLEWPRVFCHYVCHFNLHWQTSIQFIQPFAWLTASQQVSGYVPRPVHWRRGHQQTET